MWDILNAGPRHRFTVEGLLVSNCMEVFDFVGNSGKHKLVSTADVLAGDIPERLIVRGRPPTYDPKRHPIVAAALFRDGKTVEDPFGTGGESP